MGRRGRGSEDRWPLGYAPSKLSPSAGRAGSARRHFPPAARGCLCTPASVPAPRRRPGPKGCRRRSSSCGVRPDRPDTETAGRRWGPRPQSWQCGPFRRHCPASGWCRSSAHPVARDPRVASAAVEHHRLHHLPHDRQVSGLITCRLHTGSMCSRTCPPGPKCPTPVGLHQPAAVDHSTDGRGHFRIGDLAALPEGAGGKLHRAHAVGGVVQALFRLGGQVDAGGLPQAKGCKVVAEGLFAQPCPDLDKALVAGVFQRLGHGLAAVALVVGAVEPGARHRDGLAAVKGGVFGSRHRRPAPRRR